MASIRELKSRIKSVSSTKKITKAQELIATSRIFKAQARVTASLPYSQEMTDALSRLASSTSNISHILISPRENVKRSGVVIITSDRGMCGGYNSNIFKEADRLTKMLVEKNKEPVYFILGNKGISHFIYRDQPVAGAWGGFSQDPAFSDIRPIQQYLQQLLEAGSEQTVPLPHFRDLAAIAVNTELNEILGIDELFLVSSHFVSMLVQEPRVRIVAPLELEIEEIPVIDDGVSEGMHGTKEHMAQYEFEPAPEELLKLILPKYLGVRLFTASLDAAAAESASRRTAMKSATDNATELEKSLKLQVNSVRQALITSEISEIVGTTAALTS